MYMDIEECLVFVLMTNKIDSLVHDLNLLYLINLQIDKFDLYHIKDMILVWLIPSNLL